MKRILLAVTLSVAMLGSAVAMAEDIGVVDMRQIFRSSSQVKAINANLKKQFAPQRAKIVSLGKSLQSNVKKFKKNQSVMSGSNAAKLRSTIQQQSTELRQDQAKFQQDLFAAQNQAMAKFMKKVKGVVGKIAAKKKLEIVLPKNNVLYAKGTMDITSDVKSAL